MSKSHRDRYRGIQYSIVLTYAPEGEEYAPTGSEIQIGTETMLFDRNHLWRECIERNTGTSMQSFINLVQNYIDKKYFPA